MQLGLLRPMHSGLVGDAGEVTRQLLAATSSFEVSDVDKRVERVGEAKQRWAAELEAMSAQEDSNPIHPRRALWEVARALPPDAIVAADVGNVCGAANAYLKFESGRQFLSGGTLGGIGVGYSTALGAKLACMDRPVISLSGDGAWSMTIQEVMTAVTEDVPVVALILNNGVYGAEQKNQIDFFDRRLFYTNLDNPDFAQLARDMGALGFSITDPASIGPNIQEALDAKRPAILDIHVDADALTEPYRRDAFRYPKRLLSRYQDRREPATAVGATD